jgi:tetratricopeptide (TPR) repeat protein
MRDRVGCLLVAAEWALEDDEAESALEFTKEAKRLAGRVASVREAHGITSYRNARYADALSEFRAVRRMTGDDSFIPMVADCERGLGRPERALDVLKGFRPSDPAVKIEAIIVGAGARGDAGQHEAALVMLDVPELVNGPDTAERLRLRYAYAATLQALERYDEADQWFATVAREDVDGLTDAHTRTTA